MAHLIDRIQKLSPTPPTKQEMQVGETPAYFHFLPAGTKSQYSFTEAILVLRLFVESRAFRLN